MTGALSQELTGLQSHSDYACGMRPQGIARHMPQEE
jgi:hypothetical protein